MRQCPFCAEDVQDAAIVCKHCHRDIPVESKTVAVSGTNPTAAGDAGTAGPAAAKTAKSRTAGLVLAMGVLVLTFACWVQMPAPIPSQEAIEARYRNLQPASSSPKAQTPAKTARAATTSIDTKLATIDCTCPVAADDPRALRFRGLLGDLSSTWYEEPQRIADVSVRAQSSLREKGISETLLNIMEGLNQAPDIPFANYEYHEHVAMYVTLRALGNSHHSAVSGLRKAMQDLSLRELRAK